jgi:hypothetical protein
MPNQGNNTLTILRQKALDSQFSSPKNQLTKEKTPTTAELARAWSAKPLAVYLLKEHRRRQIQMTAGFYDAASPKFGYKPVRLFKQKLEQMLRDTAVELGMAMKVEDTYTFIPTFTRTLCPGSSSLGSDRFSSQEQTRPQSPQIAWGVFAQPPAVHTPRIVKTELFHASVRASVGGPKKKKKKTDHIGSFFALQTADCGLQNQSQTEVIKPTVIKPIEPAKTDFQMLEDELDLEMRAHSPSLVTEFA